MQTTKNGYKYILGIVDNFSGYPMLLPLKSTDSKSIITAVCDNWINIFGVPQKIHSDNGSYFTSTDFHNFCDKFNILKTYSPPYNPQSNGIVERLFKTIKPLLYISQKERGGEWCDKLLEIAFALRSAYNKRIGKSPNEALFKVKISTMGDKSCSLTGDKIGEKKTKGSEECDKYKINDYVRIKLTDDKNHFQFSQPYKLIGFEGKFIAKLMAPNGYVCKRHLRQLKKVSANLDMKNTNVDETLP